MLGLAKRRDINAVSLLAETFGHPLYLGINGAREILKVIKKKLTIPLDIELLNQEIQEIEEELLKRKQTVQKKSKKPGDINYIG